jgi:6-phosphogluconolactonase
VSVNIEVLDDPATAVADLLVQAAGDIVITGGSSPERAYRLAAERRSDWDDVTVWFTDERCVPPEDERSNYGMVDRVWFSQVPRPPRVMRMEGELGPEAGADAYAEVLGDTQFGLMLLGLGPDAHIASLFPNRQEKYVTDRRVVAVPEAGLEPFVPRISLTRPAINGAREKIFLITGENKVEAVRRAFGDEPEPDLVAAHIRPVALYLDAAAAGR